ncbi:hypothetical protein FRB93_008619, partial [Tulasnella sp. JGI-2019a]
MMRSSFVPSLASLVFLALIGGATAADSTTCGSGMYGTKGTATGCQYCAPGTFNNGKYSNAKGASACTTCPPGSFCPGNNSNGPQLCSPGRYQPDAGTSDNCPNCPAGMYGY